MKMDHLSWSRENTFWNCGQQFAYIYGEGLRLPPGVALIRGRVTADAVEADLVHKLETKKLLELDQVLQVASDGVADAFKGEIAIDGDYEDMKLSEAKAVCTQEVQALTREYHEKIAPQINPTGIELKVEATWPNLIPIPYVGVIDVVDSGVMVRDAKTKRKAPSANDAHESDQLTVYYGLFQTLTGKPPEKLALDFVWRTPAQKKVDSRTLVTERTNEDFNQKLGRSARMIEGVEREVFLPAPRDSWKCSEKWCGFWKDHCPYGRRGRTAPTT